MLLTTYRILVIVFVSIISQQLLAQSLYSARGYWEESTKPNFLAIQKKIDKGDSIIVDEQSYYKDYQSFLKSYFEKLSDQEKQKFEQFRDRWNEELGIKKEQSPESPFEIRGRDRLTNIAYGFWYGASLNVLVEANGAAAGGIPLITAGLWGIGPAINTKKYTGISRNTVRAGNTGRLLGLFYGGSLGFMLGGSDRSEKLVFGLSTVGSIALGEAAFYAQKKNHNSAGYVELMRHYGLLGSWAGFAATFSTGESSSNLTGASLLGGGIAGLIIGDKQAKKYDYSLGDVDAITSLTNIMTGLGFAATSEATRYNNSGSRSLILIPALSSVAGTIIGQRQVKGVHLTGRQGNIINLTAGGAGLIGLGIAILAQSNSPTVNIAVPSGLALIGHQIMFKKFKMENLELGLKKTSIKKRLNFSMNLTPENYLLNKTLPLRNYTPEVACKMQGSMVSLKFTF